MAQFDLERRVQLLNMIIFSTLLLWWLDTSQQATIMDKRLVAHLHM